MLHRLSVHLVWTTRERVPIIDADRAACLERLLPTIAREEWARMYGIGIVSTHLHLLLRVHPRFDAARFVRRAKSVSALVSRREQIGDPQLPLRWAKGYSITSVSPDSVPRVLQYLANQPAHHPMEAIVRGGQVGV